jgi:signal transduction histidine kinase
MSQVIRNLVSNALKFSKPGQKVIIGAEIITAESIPSPTRHRPEQRHRHSQDHGTRPSSNRIIPDNDLPREFDLERNQRYAAQDRQLMELHGRPTTWVGYFQNLMSNFWEYMADSSHDEVSISGTISNVILKAANTAHSYATNRVDMVRITVTDSGVGISKVRFFIFFFFLRQKIFF